MPMNTNTTLYGIKSSEGEYEGKKFSSTTFYLPANFGSSNSGKAMGAVTVPYKLGDASEYKKWEHLEKSFPAAGIPVSAEFDIVVGKDAAGKDAAKIVLLSIKPQATARPAA